MHEQAELDVRSLAFHYYQLMLEIGRLEKQQTKTYHLDLDDISHFGWSRYYTAQKSFPSIPSNNFNDKGVTISLKN